MASCAPWAEALVLPTALLKSTLKKIKIKGGLVPSHSPALQQHRGSPAGQRAKGRAKVCEWGSAFLQQDRPLIRLLQGSQPFSVLKYFWLPLMACQLSVLSSRANYKYRSFLPSLFGFRFGLLC